MTCNICEKKVSQAQLDRGDAIKTADGYAHTDCIDDLSREPDDAYHREVA